MLSWSSTHSEQYEHTSPHKSKFESLLYVTRQIGSLLLQIPRTLANLSKYLGSVRFGVRGRTSRPSHSGKQLSAQR